MTSLPHDSPPPEAEGYPRANVRSIASLLIFIHLFCVVLALAGNYFPSPLQTRVLNAVAPYTNFFRLKPMVPYHLTDASEVSNDHVLEIEVTKGAQKGEIVTIPAGRVAASPTARRESILARTIGATTYAGADPNTAALSKAAGAYVLTAGQNEEVIVRCKRYQPQDRLFDSTNAATPADPADPAYLVTAYQARVWKDRLGLVQLLKIEEKKVVAPLE